MRELRSRVPVALRLLAVVWLPFMVETAQGQSARIDQERPPEQTDSVEVVHRHLAYRPESAAGVKGFERCQLDLACPRDSRGFATVVWFHGGGLSKGIESCLRLCGGMEWRLQELVTGCIRMLRRLFTSKMLLQQLPGC